MTVCTVLYHAQLGATEEFVGGDFCGNLGEVLIRYAAVTSIISYIISYCRCNNVLFVQEILEQAAPTEGEKMLVDNE